MDKFQFSVDKGESMGFFRKVTALLVFLMLFCLSSRSDALSPKHVLINIYPVHLPDIQLHLNEDKKTVLSMEGSYLIQNEQCIQMPVKTIIVPVPPNKQILHYSITHQQYRTIQPVALHRLTEKKPSVAFPSALANKVDTHQICSLAFMQKDKEQSSAVFIVQPCRYDEVNQQLTIIESFRIHLSLADPLYSTQLADVSVSNKYQHCIVAKLDKIPLFLEYKNYLEERGISTLLFPYEFASSYTGTKPQEKLRDALNTLYLKHGIESAMLVGHNSIIPMMELSIFGRDSKYQEVIPSDMFYSDLSSDWDSNDDGYYGEYEKDYPDFTNEINIGRLPFETDSEITSYLKRLLSFYEENKDNRKKILTAGSWYMFKEERYVTKDDEVYDIDGGQIAYTSYRNYFSGYQHKGLYEQEGIKVSKVINQGTALSRKNLISTINEFDPLLVLLNGNGSRYEIKQKIWIEDGNNNKMVDYLEMKERPFIDLNTFYELTNRRQSVVFADACSTLNLEVNFSLGSEFLKKNAVGFIGFTAPCYYFIPYDPNPVTYEMSTSSFGLFANTEYYFASYFNLGNAMSKGIRAYWELCKKDPVKENIPKEIQNIYGFNLFGDPLITTSNLYQKGVIDYQSQGTLQKGTKSYNIKEMLIGKDMYFTFFRCLIHEKMSNRNYQLSLFVDSDNNPYSGGPDKNGADYWFVLGYDTNSKFVYQCQQWNPTKYDWIDGPEGPFYNRFGFDFTQSAVWLKASKNMLSGTTFRYRIEFRNVVKQETSQFPENGTYADYPSTKAIPPSQPAIESVTLVNRNITIMIASLHGGTYPLKGYELYKKSQQTEYQIMKIGEVTDLTVSDTQYTPGGVYSYKVRVYDNQNPPNFSLFSEEVSITIPKDPGNQDPPKDVLPPQPVQISGLYDANNHFITIKWTTPVQGTYPLTGFDIYRGTSTDSISYYLTVGIEKVQFVDMYVQTGKTYHYYVLVRDNQTPVNVSKPSNTVMVKAETSPKPPSPSIIINLIVGEKFAYVNNRFMILDIAPLMKNNRVFVPLRFIAEAFGATVNWKEDASNNGEGSITILFTTQNGSRVTIQMHTLEKTAYVTTESDNQPKQTKTIILDAPAFIVKPANRTVVPIRFIAESFGATVEWNESNKSILITL